MKLALLHPVDGGVDREQVRSNEEAGERRRNAQTRGDPEPSRNTTSSSMIKAKHRDVIS